MQGCQPFSEQLPPLSLLISAFFVFISLFYFHNFFGLKKRAKLLFFPKYLTILKGKMKIICGQKVEKSWQLWPEAKMPRLLGVLGDEGSHYLHGQMARGHTVGARHNFFLLLTSTIYLKLLGQKREIF